MNTPDNKTEELKPEFCRIDDLSVLFGIKRGMAYNLMASGAIKSISLSSLADDAKGGTRLVHIQSVRDYLFRLMEEQKDERPKPNKA